jgi:Uma2 family endonuclease
MSAPPFNAGDWLSRREFLARWALHPEIKKAELMGGIVYLAGQETAEHAQMQAAMIGLFGYYAASTPGLQSGCNTTILILADAPQPDVHLRILPEYGGAVTADDKHLAGAPEAIAEICTSDAAYDLHQKLDIYERACVKEYIAILLHERELRWNLLTPEGYEPMPASPGGIHRSVSFPGLWIDARGMFAGDTQRVLAALQAGLKTREHAEFVAWLGRQRR